MCNIILNSPVLDQCRQRLESDLVLCKADLAPLESGEIHVGERMKDGPWVDVTDVTIAAYRRNIATIQDVLKVLTE